jgi:hypothetical protein
VHRAPDVDDPAPGDRLTDAIAVAAVVLWVLADVVVAFLVAEILRL